MLRVRASRLLGRLIYGRHTMLCAELDRRQHPARRLVDLVLARGHCAACSDWESRQDAPEMDFVGDARVRGWL